LNGCIFLDRAAWGGCFEVYGGLKNGFPMRSLTVDGQKKDEDEEMCPQRKEEGQIPDPKTSACSDHVLAIVVIPAV